MLVHQMNATRIRNELSSYRKLRLRPKASFWTPLRDCISLLMQMLKMKSTQGSRPGSHARLNGGMGAASAE